MACHKGIGISELEAVLAMAGITMNRRSLLRRISILIENGRIPEVDRDRFVNLAHTELKGLHEGNIARFRLRPAEFTAWQEKTKR